LGEFLVDRAVLFQAGRAEDGRERLRGHGRRDRRVARRDRTAASQPERASDSQKDELATLQQKLKAQTGEEPVEVSQAPASSRVIAVEPAAPATDAAETKTANLAPSDLTGVKQSSPAQATPEPARAADQAALSRDIQTKLKTLDCYRGKIDGDWGSGTRTGVERFSKIANLDLNTDKAEQATLDALAAWKGERCPDKVIVRRKRAPAIPATPPKTQAKVKKAYPATPKQAEQTAPHDFETDAVHKNLRPAQ
jgi:peptidoglycan hydrolase-like protein with peptidoglycan-binding domain